MGRWTLLVALALPLMSAQRRGDGLTDYIACTDDCPPCAAPEVTVASQRVRREVRSLSRREWNRIVDAMWVIKTTPTEIGQAQYGPNFKTYDYFVVKHAVATTDQRGDQAHFGPQFMTWHAAFVLEFELCLMAVDRRIEAVPYWDAGLTEPSVFDGTYFGSAPGTGPGTNELIDGPFAYWPIEAAFDIDDWAPYFAAAGTVDFAGSSLGFLRNGRNMNPNAYATRNGAEWAYDAAEFDGCRSATDGAWYVWYDCIEYSSSPSIHSGAHAAIGGSAGDFQDPVTSPNDPIFMFHHANMDRSKMHWMVNNAFQRDASYGYPVAGTLDDKSFEGMFLHDEVASAWPFTAGDLGYASTGPGGTLDEDYTLTHADCLCYMGPMTARYTYDDLPEPTATPQPTPVPVPTAQPTRRRGRGGR